MPDAQNSTGAQHDDVRLLYDRRSAARQLSISVRALDYLIAAKQLRTRRIGKRVLVPRSELVRYASGNHYEPLTPMLGGGRLRANS